MIKTMLLGKLKAMTAAVMVMAGFVGAGGRVYQSHAKEPPIVQQASGNVQEPAWGKPLNGLRLGLYQTDPKGDGKSRRWSTQDGRGGST
jgi:hypothetical protein